jgi:hypothetical protein
MPIISVVPWTPPDANVLPVFSLTLEASLREVTSLRQQILRIKGENSVSCLRPPHLSEAYQKWLPLGAACSDGPSRHQIGSHQ